MIRIRSNDAREFIFVYQQLGNQLQNIDVKCIICLDIERAQRYDYPANRR